MKGSRKKTKSTLHKFSDTYAVYFWKRKADGMKEPIADFYHCDGKDKHIEAMKAIRAKHKIEERDVISVKYW